MYLKECQYCKKTFVSNRRTQKYCSKTCRDSATEDNRNKGGQLCWQCKNACGGCRWSDDLIPVDGWTATPTIVRDSGADSFKSYKITHCPLFEKEI